jgi:peroxiredoxin
MTSIAFVVFALFISFGGWFGWQLLRQNGRMLLRLDELEKRLSELEWDEFGGNGEDRSARFGNRSVARSKIKRDGLKAGTSAPDFRLPCLDGTERSLQDFHGQRVLLVFSDPHCGPCQTLAPHLEKFYRAAIWMNPTPQPSPRPTGRGSATSVVMISRGEPKENRAKVKEHGLTFPVLLQQRWEVSRLYAMFATPMAYLIDEQCVILNDVAVGVEPIIKLMAEAEKQQSTAALVLDRKAEMC